MLHTIVQHILDVEIKLRLFFLSTEAEANLVQEPLFQDSVIRATG
jgi:hypothetical protein